MNPRERKALIARVEREGATVGARIPNRLSVDGEVVPLRQRVLGLQREDDPDKDTVQQLTVALRGERRERLDRLQDDPDLGRPRGEEIVDEIIGMDRALAALRALGADEDIEAAIHQQRVADAERWQHFLKRARTDTPDRSPSR